MGARATSVLGASVGELASEVCVLASSFEASETLAVSLISSFAGSALGALVAEISSEVCVLASSFEASEMLAVSLISSFAGSALGASSLLREALLVISLLLLSDILRTPYRGGTKGTSVPDIFIFNATQ